MNINERVRYLRQDILNLSQREFATAIGIKQSGLSGMERAVSGVTDRTVSIICSVYSVREEWLRDGTGEIFQEEESFSLDRFVQDHGGTDLELKIIKTYFELDPAIRRAVLDHFRNSFGQPAEKQKNSPSTEQLEEEYKKSVLDGASPTTQSAWNTTSDTAAGE